MNPPRLLGISHLLVAVDAIEPAEAALAPAGYQRQLYQPGHASPPAKAPFVALPLAERFEMALLRAQGADGKALPAIELLREMHDAPPAPGAAPFTATLKVGSVPSPAVSLAGITFEQGGEGIAACLGINCRDPVATREFWDWLGGETQEASGDILVRNRLFGPSVLLRLAPAQDAVRSSLDQRGLVALAFACKDAAALRQDMAERWSGTAAEIGKCFDITPLGKPLRLFLARSPSGEIYEFLSPLGR